MSAQTYTTVITGASKGIGLATAHRLKAMGHQVIGLARHQPEQPFPGEFIEVDLANAAATANVTAAIARQYSVSHLVNNVGMSHSETLEEVTIERFASILDLNLRPAIQLTQAFLPAMKARRYGRIINVSSLVVLGLPLRTSYAAAKAGLISMTRTWASELATTGITVNAIAPGPTETELFRTNSPVGSASEQRFLQRVPRRCCMKRGCGGKRDGRL
jgi:3-oxoacyl-[acyl-carrier protein] reductase